MEQPFQRRSPIVLLRMASLLTLWVSILGAAIRVCRVLCGTRSSHLPLGGLLTLPDLSASVGQSATAVAVVGRAARHRASS